MSFEQTEIRLDRKRSNNDKNERNCRETIQSAKERKGVPRAWKGQRDLVKKKGIPSQETSRRGDIESLIQQTSLVSLCIFQASQSERLARKPSLYCIRTSSMDSLPWYQLAEHQPPPHASPVHGRTIVHTAKHFGRATLISLRGTTQF